MNSMQKCQSAKLCLREHGRENGYKHENYMLIVLLFTFENVLHVNGLHSSKKELLGHYKGHQIGDSK